MIVLRRLSKDGLIEFRSYLSRVSAGVVESPPRELLEDPRTSETAPVTPDLTDVQFESKRAAAVWLGFTLARLAQMTRLLVCRYTPGCEERA